MQPLSCGFGCFGATIPSRKFLTTNISIGIENKVIPSAHWPVRDPAQYTSYTLLAITLTKTNTK